MEPWQIAIAAAAGGALLLASRGGSSEERSDSGGFGADSGGFGADSDVERASNVQSREALYGLPEPPTALAAEIYGMSEAEISAELDEIAQRLVPAVMTRVGPNTWRYVRKQLEHVSAGVARIYGPDNAYFPVPASVGQAERAASISVLNEITFEINKEAHLRWETMTRWKPASSGNLYTMGALEADWVNYIETVKEFTEAGVYGGSLTAGTWTEYLFLFPNSGERWPLIAPTVQEIIESEKKIAVAPNTAVNTYGKNAGPWYLGPSGDGGAINATQLAMSIAGTAGEAEMAASAEGLEAGWRAAQGAARQVLARKFTNALVPLSRASIQERGTPLIWDFACDPRGECRG